MQTQRKTVFMVAGVLLALAAFSLWRGHSTRAEIVSGVALLLALAAAASEAFARRFHVFWMRVAHRLGALNTFVLLALVYAFGFIPYGWIGRVFGLDPLGRRQPSQQTYWVARSRTRQQNWQFERLY
jgi:hypothetical protein